MGAGASLLCDGGHARRGRSRGRSLLTTSNSFFKNANSGQSRECQIVLAVRSKELVLVLRNKLEVRHLKRREEDTSMDLNAFSAQLTAFLVDE